MNVWRHVYQRGETKVVVEYVTGPGLLPDPETTVEVEAAVDRLRDQLGAAGVRALHLEELGARRAAA